MQAVKKDDRVTVTYEGTLDNGEIFESTADAGPLDFRVGDGSVLPGFEKTLLGMCVGEEKTVTIPAAEAFGPPDKELIMTVKRRLLGEKVIPQPGMVLAMNMEKDGKTLQVPAMVTAINDEYVTVDFNHPLAGKNLIYKITLVALHPAS